jgi:cyclophilin family peptidyl-prolyl cis-trans isomerase/HEAT repeat protein
VLEAADTLALAQLLRMEDGRELDAQLAGMLLRSGTPEVRRRAALAVGRVRDARGAGLLLDALGDPHPGVRAAAAFGLGVLGDSSAAVMEGLTATALTDTAAPAAEAVAALGRLAAAAGRAAIDSILVGDHQPLPVRHEALLAAWRLPRDAGTTERLLRWTTHPDPETRWRAVYALGRSAGPDAVPVLLDALADPDDRVRANAARGLRAPVADSAGHREAAFAAVIAAAGDPHPHVRINALRLLPAFQDESRALPVLAGLLEDPDVNVAVAAAQALGETADPAAAGPLRRTASDVRRPDGLRTPALAAWMRVDAAAAATVAAAWADSARWILRYHAARSLGAAPWQAAEAPLLRLARDAHPLVSAEALGALRAAADTAPQARAVFIERLGAGHALVRAAAARGLGRNAAATDLDVLLNAWERARHDTIRDAAMAVVDALGRMARDGVPVDRSFFLRFGQHGPPADPVLHRAIVERIGRPPAGWGEPRLRPEPRPGAFYSEVVRELMAPALRGEQQPVVAITTPHGDILLELAAAEAPLTVHNFLTLLERGYYSGLRWHRVVPNFVIQDGDPRGDGSGGPGWAIRDEINPLRYLRGTLGMALSGPDTGGSQFFITHSPQPHLDGGYTIFGRVSDGLHVVDAVVQEEPILAIRRVR